MFEHLVVPVDLSPDSFQAVPVAARMAAQVGGRVDVVTVVDGPADVDAARDELARGIDRLAPLAAEAGQIVYADRSVAGALSQHLEDNPGAMLAMASHGHGRSALVLGSTVDDVLRATFGPVIVIGPHAAEAAGTLSGPYAVPLDGSERADQVLPIVGAWVAEFGATPWLIEVLDEAVDASAGSDFVESSFVNRRAVDLARQIHRPVEFEVLHGRHPAASIVDFVESQNASLIFMSTHGRTGFERLVSGSVAADVIRHARVPVVVFRPPMLQADRAVAAPAAGATS